MHVSARSYHGLLPQVFPRFGRRMHLLRPRIFMRLIVPTLEATLFKCLPAQTPCALAFEYVRMDAIEIPTSMSLFSEGVEDSL